MTYEQYGNDPLQSYRVFNYSKSNKSIVFIHGGAWRDTRNTFDDFVEISEYISKLSDVNIFGINYRLSPKVKHPAHLEDAIAAIEHIANKYEVGELLLVGHSAGATLILQLLREHPNLNLKAAVYLDGIFDIAELIQEYPSYIGFIEEAFNVLDYTTLTGTQGEQSLERPQKSLIIQSTEDELLSTRQSELFAKYLEKHSLDFKYLTDSWGLHEQVYKNSNVGDLIIGVIG